MKAVDNKESKDENGLKKVQLFFTRHPVPSVALTDLTQACPKDLSTTVSVNGFDPLELERTHVMVYERESKQQTVTAEYLRRLFAKFGNSKRTPLLTHPATTKKLSTQRTHGVMSAGDIVVFDDVPYILLSTGFAQLSKISSTAKTALLLQQQRMRMRPSPAVSTAAAAAPVTGPVASSGLSALTALSSTPSWLSAGKSGEIVPSALRGPQVAATRPRPTLVRSLGIGGASSSSADMASMSSPVEIKSTSAGLPAEVLWIRGEADGEKKDQYQFDVSKLEPELRSLWDAFVTASGFWKLPATAATDASGSFGEGTERLVIRAGGHVYMTDPSDKADCSDDHMTAMHFVEALADQRAQEAETEREGSVMRPIRLPNSALYPIHRRDPGPSTGFRWEILHSPSMELVSQSVELNKACSPGAPGVITFFVRRRVDVPDKEGSVELICRKKWEIDRPTDTREIIRFAFE